MGGPKMPDGEHVFRPIGCNLTDEALMEMHGLAPDGFAVWSNANADWFSVPDFVGDEPGWSLGAALECLRMDKGELAANGIDPTAYELVPRRYTRTR